MTQDQLETTILESQLKPALEGLLFVAPGPISIPVLARTTGWPIVKVRSALNDLAADLDGRGLNLQVTANAVQLTTDPGVAHVVRKFLGSRDDGRLSRGALETLSIVAFKQPVLRTTIDAMRGVSSDYMLGKLKERGLVEEVGRASAPGRPLLYGTTFGFLEHFGLSSLTELRSTAIGQTNGNHPADDIGPAADTSRLSAATALVV